MPMRLCRSFTPDVHRPTADFHGFDHATVWAIAWTGACSVGGVQTDGTITAHAAGLEGSKKMAEWHREFPVNQNMPVLQWLVLLGYLPIINAVRAFDRFSDVDMNDMAAVLEAAAYMLRGHAKYEAGEV